MTTNRKKWTPVALRHLALCRGPQQRKNLSTLMMKMMM
jgi:hypothetical protein